MYFRENVPLAPLTTLKVGGPARFFARAKYEEDVIQAFEYASRNALQVFVLGGGSNILVSDKGFDGLVIQIAQKGISTNGPVITAQAGEDWDEFVRSCVERNLAGIECLSGIPGFVGGTPVQNVGAYGQEVSETIVTVRCFDRSDREIVELDNSACGFTYRRSIFNSTARDRYVVLAVTYVLTENGAPSIAYKDLREYFTGRSPTLLETREAVLKIRRAKSMVIDPGDPNSRSAGSFFKNPVVDQAVLDSITAERQHANVPYFTADNGRVKIPAAWLIEQSGFRKGYRLGNAGISTNHSLAIVNFGRASATEIVDLKTRIQEGVEQKFGIHLQPEPVFVGFDQ
ncbi:MAG TPA: UDP-N-acetylmuramate dehydrogenase [Pyrinomonadaceae bacterium]